MLKRIINKFKKNNNPIQININITGTLKVDGLNSLKELKIGRELDTTSTSISKNIDKSKKEIEIEIEPQINSINIPQVEFGDEIDGR